MSLGLRPFAGVVVGMGFEVLDIKGCLYVIIGKRGDGCGKDFD